MLNVYKSGADMLVMTEGAYFGAAAQRDCFEELGVEEYEIIATLDSHTSEICQSMNGKRFAVKEFRAGDTAPPFHPWCRSTVCPCFDDDFKESAGDGEKYRIPDDLNYQDWKKAFVDGGDKSAFAGVDKSGNGDIIKETDKFIMPTAKIDKFLLKPGAKHAKEFFDVGYTTNDGERLLKDIELGFDETKVWDIKESDSKIRFSITMKLGVTEQKDFQTVWQKDPNGGKPRFLTAHRIRRK